MSAKRIAAPKAARMRWSGGDERIMTVRLPRALHGSASSSELFTSSTPAHRSWPGRIISSSIWHFPEATNELKRATGLYRSAHFDASRLGMAAVGPLRLQVRHVASRVLCPVRLISVLLPRLKGTVVQGLRIVTALSKSTLTSHHRCGWKRLPCDPSRVRMYSQANSSTSWQLRCRPPPRSTLRG